MALVDVIGHDTVLEVYKYEDEAAYERGEPYEIGRHRGNLLLSGGVTALMKLLTGATQTPYNNANAHIAIGDSSTAAASGQTDVLAATNKGRWPMIAGSPGYSANQVSFSAKVPSSEGNFAWNEFVIVNHPTSGSGDALNRVVSAQGTKTNGQVWVALVNVTFV